jgi:outer membrane receptor protein involved in Fe transport
MKSCIRRSIHVGLFLSLTSFAVFDSPAVKAEETAGNTELSLADILNMKVVTSSRKLESLDEAPNTMYVITATEIKHRGIHTLRELLRTIPGFGVFHKDIQFVAQVRGIAPNDNEKIGLLLNGHNIGNVVEPDWANGPIDLAIADRVEIIVGPGSILYGTDALLATINIITKKVDRNEINAAIGNHLKDGTALLGSKAADDKYVTATATAMQKPGWDAWASPGAQAPGSGTLLAGNTNTGQLDPSYFLFGAGQMGEWGIQVNSLNNTFPDLKHAGIVAATNQPENGKRYERVDSFVINNDHKWNETAGTRFNLSVDNKRLVRAFTAGDPTTQGESTYDLAQQTYRSEAILDWRSGRNYLQAGIQGRADQNHNDYMFNWAPGNPSFPPTAGANQIQQMIRDEDTYALGVYVSDEYKLLDNLKLVGAARLDKNSMLGFDNTYFSPRLAAVYTPYKQWITKVLYNTATRTPTIWASHLNEVWGQGNPASPSWGAVNPLVHAPEVLSTIEWQNIYTVGASRLMLSIYYEHLKDFIAWAGPFTNTGNFNGRGAEFSVMSAPAQWVNVWGNASYSATNFSPEVSSTAFGNSAVTPSGEMNAAPSFMANAGTDLVFWEKFFVSPALRYFTHQPTFDPISNSWGYSNNRFYVDLTLTLENVVKDLDMAVQGFNILNNKNSVAAQYYQGKYSEEGFEVAFQLTYRL